LFFEPPRRRRKTREQKMKEKEEEVTEKARDSRKRSIHFCRVKD